MKIDKIERSFRAPSSISRVISFTSGKGGVGKTSLVVNVAIGLARQGKSVLILDGDLGLANVDVLLGLRSRFTLTDFFLGQRTLSEIMINGPEGISIVPASNGNSSLCNLTNERRMMLMQAVEQMPISFDYILIDTPAGIGPDVLYFNGASNEIVFVVTPDPTSMTDAYALMKVLAREYGEKHFSVVCNAVDDAEDGNRTYTRLQRSVERFLHVHLKYLGFVPQDDVLCEAVRAQRALLELYPSSKASRSITTLVEKIESSFYERRIKGGLQFFFRQLLEFGSEQDHA